MFSIYKYLRIDFNCKYVVFENENFNITKGEHNS